MTQVNRICSHCGGNVALQARYCGSCGYDTSRGLPVERNTLPATVSKAALPVVVGLAGFALRTGWKLLQAQLTQAASRQTLPTTRPETAPSRRSRRTIHIRSSWAVGDASGIWRRGQEEHTIEIDE